ncbi:tRNA 2-selenouridine(34) synthase MnmH [Candidatus Woesearchaeota archaeon]|jgi:tRNA 2-selenouridine synthase|nr:tRNA 2-selenouridine(34) synthase MnmH [Candidatus Woesearchaeota archaeon]
MHFFKINKKFKTIKASFVFEVKKQDDYVLVDVRSPSEWELDRIPGSINIPILDDLERAEVGTIFTKSGLNLAIEKGLEFVEPKLDDLLLTFSKFKQKKIIIYCWRGGLRSKSVVQFLEMNGFDVFQLEKGVKAYRHFVRKKISSYKLKPRLIIIYGMGLSGKTELLNKTNLHMIDLEGIAQHRSSVYGALGFKPRSQKLFEAIFLDKIEELKDVDYILVEGESKRIGRVVIPDFFYALFKSGVQIRLDASLDRRAQRFLDDYCDNKNKINEFVEITKNSQLFVKIMGKNKVLEIISLISSYEPDKITAGLKILLKDYYDIKYEHFFKDKNFDLVLFEDDVLIALQKIEKHVSVLRLKKEDNKKFK